MAGNISFASFNLYNFQEVGEKVYNHTVTQAEYNKKLKWTQDTLIDVDADVIGFQELWSRSCLDDVLSHPDLQDYTPFYIKNGNTPWYNIAVAGAVRKPWKVTYKKVIKDFPFTDIIKIDENDGEDDEFELKIGKFSRSVLRLTLENDDDASIPKVTVFIAHLKSKLPSNVKHITSKHRKMMGSAVSTIRRTAEASALRWILTNYMKGSDKATVLLGDLNDDPRSNTLSLITEQPQLHSTARGGDNALYSCLQLQQLQSFRDIFYTHEYNRVKDTIDHILVSEEFFENSSDAKWRHLHTRVWNDFVEDDHKHTSDHGILKSSFKYL